MLLFDLLHPIDLLAIPFTLRFAFIRSRGEPCIEDFFRHGNGCCSQTQSEHVSVIPDACASRSFGVMAQRGTNARHFAGGMHAIVQAHLLTGWMIGHRQGRLRRQRHNSRQCLRGYGDGTDRSSGYRLYCLSGRSGYVPQERGLSISRYNRQLHRYATLLEFCLDTLRVPAPVCKRKRAWRCRKVRSKDYCGFCAVKNEKFFGWRLHLICTPDGVPVTFTLLPAWHHDLTPLYELTVDLPADASLYGDKGYNTAPGEQWLLLDGLRLIPIRKANMTPHLR